MDLRSKLKMITLLIGDVAALYAALFLALIIRYGTFFYGFFITLHALPFTIIFAIWIVVFYIAGLYDMRRLRNNLDFLKIFGLTLFVNAIIAVFFFYLIPAFGITPKTNLFIFIVCFAIIGFSWRRVFNRALARGEAPTKVLLVGSGNAAQVTQKCIAENPQLGYEIKKQLMEQDLYADPKRLFETAIKDRINLVIVPRGLKHDARLNKALYDLLGQGIEVRDEVHFHELIMRKIPVMDIEESWFLENLINQQKFYDQLKRAGEFVAALGLGILLLPVLVLIALFVAITSSGPVIYKQKRVGMNDKAFTFYKFRSMKQDAEKNGAQWKASGTSDPRLTPIGRMLVTTHLDELPQLLNILKGELSFVGPRPERPEFVELLKGKVPYYEIRHLIKPGVTGWAQVNYRYGASIDDSREKLEYDIYYIKNRSVMLDVAIVLKTLKSLFINQA